MKIIRPFSSLMVFTFFLLGLFCTWTNQSPLEIYHSLKNLVTETSLLSFEQKVAINHVIRQTEEALATLSGRSDLIEHELDDEEDLSAEDYIIGRAVEKDEKFWKELN